MNGFGTALSCFAGILFQGGPGERNCIQGDELPRQKFVISGDGNHSGVVQ